MDRLSQMLGNAEGRKVYGYLKKPLKAQVDAIVDELAKLPEVAACYEEWNRLRDEVERYYKDTPREHQPLSRQKEFRAIKNMVIREAENLRLEVFTFEDEDRTEEMDGEQEAEIREDSRQELWGNPPTRQRNSVGAGKYRNGKSGAGTDAGTALGRWLPGGCSPAGKVLAGRAGGVPRR